MVTPYDWQEGMGHRAQFVESRLAEGMPVVAVSLAEGVIVASWRRQARKVFEIYDRLAFAAIGRQSDIEALRVAAVDFAHKEGYARSEQDVTVQRVVTALSEPIKRAFGDFNSAPFVVRSLFAEVGDAPAQDLFYLLDYDGDFRSSKEFGLVAGSEATADLLEAQVRERSWSGMKPAAALAALEGFRLTPEGEPEVELPLEAVLLERSSERENRFRYLTAEPD